MQTLDLASKIKIDRPRVNRFDCVNLRYETEYESKTATKLYRDREDQSKSLGEKI